MIKLKKSNGVLEKNSILEEGEQSTLEQSMKVEKIWWKYPCILRLNFLLLGAIMAQFSAGYDEGYIYLVNYFPEGYLGQEDKSGVDGRINLFGPTIGTLIISPFTWILSDYLGRRWSIIFGSLIIIIGIAIETGAIVLAMISAGRVLIGIGTGISTVAALPLLGEAAYPLQRTNMMCMVLVTRVFGIFLGSLVTWGIIFSGWWKNLSSYSSISSWGWRLPIIIQLLFPIFQIVVTFYGPESPRWLIKKKRIKEARYFFINYHYGGDENNIMTRIEVDELVDLIIKEQEVGYINLLSYKNKSYFGSRVTLWVGDIRRFHHLCLVIVVPIMVQLCNKYLIIQSFQFFSEIIELNHDIYYAIFISIFFYGLIWASACALLVNKWRRKFMFYTSFTLICITYIVFTIFTAIVKRNKSENYKEFDTYNTISYQSLAVGGMVMIYFFYGFYQIIYPMSLAYVTELSPYPIRSQGVTLYLMFFNGMEFFNYYADLYGIKAISWKYNIIWCIWPIFQIIIVYFFYIETKGWKFEEIIGIFE